MQNWRLDLLISEVFSNLYDSMILWLNPHADMVSNTAWGTRIANSCLLEGYEHGSLARGFPLCFACGGTWEAGLHQIPADGLSGDTPCNAWPPAGEHQSAASPRCLFKLRCNKQTGGLSQQSSIFRGHANSDPVMVSVPGWGVPLIARKGLCGSN